MKKALIILVAFMGHSGFTQIGKTDPEYVQKLKELYKNTVEVIYPEALSRKLTSKDLYILDTRSEAEYKVSHIQGARFVDHNSFKLHEVKDIPKDAEVVVYCSVGWRSERVGEKLQKAGYNNVKNLYGGIFEWVNQGYQVYNDTGVTKKVHAYSEKWAKWIK